MHGVKRPPKSATSAESRAARKAKEASKLAAYLEIEQTFFTYKRESRKDITALEHTTTLLTLNPELYTVWNYRREVLLALFTNAVEEVGGKADVFASLRDGNSSSEAKNAEGKDEEERIERNQNLLEDDLMLTEHALRAHPKVYWIWNHRMWCLTQYPPSSNRPSTWVWERELSLVEKMLNLDPRNFHGWNSRRDIVQQLALLVLVSSPSTSSFASTQPTFPTLLSNPLIIHPDNSEIRTKLLTLADKELAYTLRRIESNFSNFSAWHQRTKLLPHTWSCKQLSQEQVDNEVDTELELVKQAMYTDPSDQSIWFYHRWLVELLLQPCPGGGQEERRERQVRVMQEEIRAIEELFELEPESKWCAISLAHYQMLLGGLYEGDKAVEALGKAKKLLAQLIELDPDREQRYQDLLEGKAHF